MTVCKPYIKPAAAPGMSWSVPGLCAAYRFPKVSADGIIGIGELGGGYLTADNTLFFRTIKQPVPTIINVSLDGTDNNPGHSDADGEVALDIQVAAAAYFAATGKPATIRMYWGKNSSNTIRDITKRAADDGCDVLSWSWGAREPSWGKKAATEMDAAALYGLGKGMITLAASGDNDSSDGGFGPAVDLPASCPHVIGCGGTHKTPNSETVWNNNPGHPNGSGTGGGFSMYFPMPAWQAGAPHGPGRMVPDVAGNADPGTGYQVVLRGQWNVFGGTSAVAPLWAGLLAACGKKLGSITPKLYLNHLAFSDITSGDNGMYRARPGPDACTGLGSPIGTAIAKILGA